MNLYEICRYSGKEKDEESGLYYHGARYYACWLGRWTAADPIGLVDGVNLYMYVRGNPVRLHDPSGNASEMVLDEVEVKGQGPKQGNENNALNSKGSESSSVDSLKKRIHKNDESMFNEWFDEASKYKVPDLDFKGNVVLFIRGYAEVGTWNDEEQKEIPYDQEFQKIRTQEYVDAVDKAVHKLDAGLESEVYDYVDKSQMEKLQAENAKGKFFAIVVYMHGATDGPGMLLNKESYENKDYHDTEHGDFVEPRELEKIGKGYAEIAFLLSCGQVWPENYWQGILAKEIPPVYIMQTTDSDGKKVGLVPARAAHTARTFDDFVKTINQKWGTKNADH